MKPGQNEPIRVEELTDNPSRGLKVFVFWICVIAGFMDGLATQSINTVAAAIASHLRLTALDLRPAFMVALAGAALGALTFGALGDRFGRKRMLAVAAWLIGIFTFATIHARTYEELLVIRFAAGLGLGGAIPCYLALAAEFLSERWRLAAASLVWVAYPVGGSIGGAGTRFAVGAVHRGLVGGDAIFLMSCAMPFVLLAVLVLWVPESPMFLADRKNRRGLVAARGHWTRGMPLGRLFTEGRAGQTFLSWVSVSSALGVMILSALWAPHLLRDHGIAATMSSTAVSFNALGAVSGMACAGWLIHQFGAGRILVPAFLLGALATMLAATAAPSMPVFAAELFGIGIFVGTCVSGTIALATVTYPTAIRSSGIGATIAMGRVGQVVLPFIVANAARAGRSDIQLFVGLALLLSLCALALFAGRSTIQPTIGKSAGGSSQLLSS